MKPTSSDRAAVVETVERLTEAVEEVKVELGGKLGADERKGTVVVASALWLTTATAFAAAYRDEEAFVQFMRELMPGDADLRTLYRKTHTRLARGRSGRDSRH